MLDLIIFGLILVIVAKGAAIILDNKAVKGMLKAFNFEQAKEEEGEDA